MTGAQRSCACMFCGNTQTYCVWIREMKQYFAILTFTALWVSSHTHGLHALEPCRRR